MSLYERVATAEAKKKKVVEDEMASLFDRVVLSEAKAKATVAAVAEHIKWLLDQRRKQGIVGVGGISMTDFMAQYDGEGSSRQVQALLRSRAAEVGKAAGLKNLRLEKGYTRASSYDPSNLQDHTKSVRGGPTGRRKVPAQIVWGKA